MYLKSGFIFFLIYCTSCRKQEPASPPAYIHINSIQLQTNLNTQGSASCNITDAWIYLDDVYFGTFPLPAVFPVLLSGLHRLKVCPGIKVNGVGGSRTPYPFYTSYLKEVQFSGQQYMDVDVTYISNANIIWLEDFEGNNKSSGMTIENNLAYVFEGKGSGKVYLDNINTFAEFKSNSNFALPKSGAPIYIELNYKTNLPFSLNLTTRKAAVYTAVPVGGGKPSSNWKKIYFDLLPAVAANADADDYGISITLQNGNSSTGGVFFLDNVKLVCKK